MKSKAYMDELRMKDAQELENELMAAKKELFNLRFQNATNQLDNTSRIKEVRRNIARIQTVRTLLTAKEGKHLKTDISGYLDRRRQHIRRRQRAAAFLTALSLFALLSNPSRLFSTSGYNTLEFLTKLSEYPI